MKAIADKLPPQALDFEAVVLGIMILESSSLKKVRPILQEAHFYADTHRIIFRGIESLQEKKLPVDLLTLTNELKAMQLLNRIGGPVKLIDLTNRVAGSANIEYYARIIQQKFIQRSLIEESIKLQNVANDPNSDPLEALATHRKALDNLARNNLGSNIVDTIATTALEISNQIDVGVSPIKCIKTGITDLNQKVNSWKAGDLYIIAARPGMGKTGLLLSEANQLAKRHVPSLIFSLEMTKSQLSARYLSIETGVDVGRIIRNENLNKEEKDKIRMAANDHLGKLIFIDDKPRTTPDYINHMCMKMVEFNGVQIVFDDYIQLHGSNSTRFSSREEDVSEVTRMQKSIAKLMDVPYIALSQLNRAVEKRGGAARPQLSDLRESGAIEQDADAVLFIYRPEYYGHDKDDDNNDTVGKAEIIIAKHRNGPLGKVVIRFIETTTEFTNLSNINLQTQDEF